jgi:hypothetical protein
MTEVKVAGGSKNRLILSVVAGTVVVFGSLFVMRGRQAQSRSACPVTDYQPMCVVDYMLPSSFDALPKEVRADWTEVQSRTLKTFLQPGIGFRFRIGSEGEFQILESRARQAAVRQELRDPMWGGKSLSSKVRFGVLEKAVAGADVSKAGRAKAISGRKASCDPENPWVLGLYNEPNLRRCLRALFLLENLSEFNSETQKLFHGSTIRYADGSTGPLSLVRKGINDSDRSKVVDTVRTLDTRARASSGYR